jgi:DNA-binding MarR family transcriptional regulator
MNLGSLRDETQDHPFRINGVRGPQYGEPVRFERGGGPLHTGSIRDGPESSLDVSCSCHATCNRKDLEVILLHAQRHSKTEVAAVLDRLVRAEIPGGRGLGAWTSLLQAHATLLRRLDTDLEKETGLALADFDVLAQLARAGGELRMTELAARALISRSGMTRRVARLVDEGLVRRASAETDARGVVVALTKAGMARLARTAPVHARGIRRLFIGRLDDQELAALESALGKVILDSTFG